MKIYNATVLILTISELANITSQIFIQNKTSVSEASLCTMVLALSFQLLKSKPFYGGRLFEKIKINAYRFTSFRYVTCISYTIKDASISEICLGKFPLSGNLALTKCHSFSWSVEESAFHKQTRICNSVAF